MKRQIKIKGGEVEVDYRIDMSIGDYHTPATSDIDILTIYIKEDVIPIFDSYNSTEDIYEDIREAIREIESEPSKF